MKENHLIIGLGGTGGHIIRAFRKRVWEEFRTNEIPNEKVEDVCVSYLWVDSSENDLNETQSWRTMGKSVALDPGDKVEIAATSSSILDEMKREPNRYPGIAPWIGDQKTWDHIKGGITDKAGGQRRRLGRLLFAWNIDKFQGNLVRHTAALIKESKNQSITFHICCGLAGGTGSGCIVDVITQIRELYPDDKIIIYAKLPETATPPPPSWVSNTGYYKPNGYAALLELNALSTKSYQPFDVKGKKDRTGKVIRMLTERGIEAFDTAYIFANGNASYRVLDVENGQLFQVVSDFLFYKIVVLKQVGGKNVNFENPDGNPEDGTRSKRFQSFGIARIEYPEKEITEYVQYNFEKQAMLQFKYNNWSDLGFIEKNEEEIGLGYKSDLRNDRNGVFPKWRIDEEHLSLSQKIVDDNRNPWLSFSEDWNKVIQFKTLAKEKDKTEWLIELEKLCEKRYKESFRGVGVLEFFRNQKEEIKGYASHIRGLIERDLFKDWENGDKSVVEVEKFLDILIDVNENRIEKLGEKQQKKRLELKEKIEPKITESREKWNKRGILTNLDKLLGTHCDLLRRKYQTLTEEEGLDFAQQLLRRVNEQLRELRDTITGLKKLITTSLDSVEVAISSRCKSGNNVSTGENIITTQMYEPDEIKKRTKSIMSDDKICKENALKVRKKLIEEIRDDSPDFSKMAKRISGSPLFSNTFEEVCNESAVSAMEQMQKKYVKVNILEKIANEYRDDEEGLGKYIQDQITLSDILCQKNARETVAYGGDALTMQHVIYLPQYEDTSNFRDKFIQRCRSIAQANVTVTENNKSNEIIIITVVNGFPLRYLADVERLKKDYDAKMTDIKEDQHKLLLHTEGDGLYFLDGKPVPSLYVNKWNDDKKEEFSPYLMLAMAAGLIKYGFRGEGFGNQKVYYIDDDKKTSLKHQTYRNVIENITEDEAENIKKAVEDKLNTGEYLSKAKREALKQEIKKDGAIYRNIEKECGKNKSDWNKFVDAIAPAIEILDKDKQRLTD